MARKPASRKKKAVIRPVSHWDKLDRKWQHAICIAFLLLLPVILYSNVIFGGEKFMAHDILQWRASAESVIEHRETYGQEPLWATNMFSGMPAYIVSYVRSVPHIDNIYSWFSTLFPVTPLWIMMIGMYLFLVRLKLHPLAAALGALLVAMTTYMPIIVGAGHNAKVYALSFIPWMLYGFHMLTRSQKKLLGFVVFALAVNLELRAGHPQVTYFFLYLFAIWWIYDLIQASKSREIPAWAKNTGLLIAAGIIALLCNLQPYWSIYEYSPYSIRGGAPAEETTGLGLDYAMAWSQGWFELSTLFIPEIMGGASKENMYWGDKTFTSGPHYLGALAYFLALLALFKAKSGLKWVFLSAGILTMLFSLGKNFSAFNYLFFNYMPFYDKFRAPEMWLMVTTLSFNTLAAMGAHWLFTIEREQGDFSLKDIRWPAGIALGTGLVYLLLINSVLSFEKPGEFQMMANQIAQQNNVSPDDPRVSQVVNDYIQDELMPPRMEAAQNDTLRFLLFTVLGIAAAGLFVLAKIPAFVAVSGFLLLFAVDLISTGSRYLPEEATIPKSWDMERALEQQKRPYHGFIQNEMAGLDYPYRVFPVDQNPFNNAVPAYFYPSIGGYTGAKMNRYQDLIDNAVYHDETGLNFSVMNMLNVAYITARQPFSLPGYEVAYQGDDGAVMYNTNVLPKVFFPKQAEYVTRPADALKRLATDFDASETVVIESLDEFEHRADSLAGFSMHEYNARKIAFEVSKNAPGWMVLSEMYYPAGWKAYVDGEEKPIYPANYVLRAIHLEAGDHTVEFVFNPRSYTVGSTVSWIFNLLLLGLFAAALLTIRKPEEETPA